MDDAASIINCLYLTIAGCRTVSMLLISLDSIFKAFWSIPVFSIILIATRSNKKETPNKNEIIALAVSWITRKV